MSIDAELTDKVKKNAHRYGFDLVGIASADALDAVPHYIAHRDYLTWTMKTGDYLEGASIAIILGARVWDNLHDLVIRVGDHHEYPDEWRTASTPGEWSGSSTGKATEPSSSPTSSPRNGWPSSPA
jgi:hypothetical protein